MLKLARISSALNKSEKKPDLLESLTKQRSDDKSAKMISKELINAKDIDLKTHLTEDETLTFAKSDFFADEFETEGFKDCALMIRDFSISIAKKRLSYNRLSRVEFAGMAKPEINEETLNERSEGTKLVK